MIHPTHDTRMSMSSSIYDLKCTRCGLTDNDDLSQPCGQSEVTETTDDTVLDTPPQATTVWVSELLGEIDVTITSPSEQRHRYLASQFSPQVGDMIMIDLDADDEPLYGVIAGIGLDGYLVSYKGVIQKHHPLAQDFLDDAITLRTITTYRKTPFEWFTLKTVSGKTLYYVNRPGQTIGQGEVYDEKMEYIKSVTLDSNDESIKGGLDDEIKMVLGKVHEEFHSFIHAVYPEDAVSTAWLKLAIK